MKKFLEDKILIGMIIIILFELILIIRQSKMQDAGALATIASAILIYLTLHEASKNNTKQLEMQTKIALFQKRMKFREELVDFTNNHSSYIYVVCTCDYILYMMNLENQLRKLLDKDQSANINTIQTLWQQIFQAQYQQQSNIINYFDGSSIHTTSKLLLDGKLLFHNSEKIITYIEQLTNKSSILGREHSKIIAGMLGLAQNNLIEEDYSLKSSIVLDVEKIKILFTLISTLKSDLQTLAKKSEEERANIITRFEEIDKVIQEEAQLLSK